MKYAILTIIAAVALTVPAAGALKIDSVVSTERYLVGFIDNPGYEVGQFYQGNRIVAVDNDLNFVVVETSNAALLGTRVTLDNNVRYLEPDASDHQLLLTPNDSLYGDAGMYGVKITKINLAWDTTVGTTAVRISDIDTGINKAHEDAGGARILQGYDFKNGDTDPNDESLCSYHGSHTAGTFGATINNGKGIAGVAQATINPIKIFGKGGGQCGTTTTAIVNALKYTGDQGDHVSSNSWGGGSYSTAINDAITYAVNKGVTIVAAAGNSGPCTNCVGEPWKDATATVIVVACSDSADKQCSFSSEGPQVDVIAPGYQILSVDGGTTTGYKLLSGTSMSTPHVTGVAGLVKTQHPTYTPDQIQTAIKASADNIGLSTDKQGAGRLNGQGAIV